MRSARQAQGHTQESLARLLGLTARAVAGWELGQTAPTRKNLERLAAELDRTPAWFYAEHDEDPVAA